MEPTQRFSGRVEHYRRYRPGYPDTLFNYLRRSVGVRPDWAVADLGAGTGLLTERLLEIAARVYAVEPNAEMRRAAEEALDGEPGFAAVDGRAEATGLPDGSVHLVTAAQAFHWFDVAAARAECLRILRPGGVAALVWNTRDADCSAFLRAYNNLLLRYGLDYGRSGHRFRDRDRFARFFGHHGYRRKVFANLQRLDAEGVRGRLLSSSYTPPPGHPRHEPMLEELERIFRKHQRHGLVSFAYQTELYWAPLTRA